MKYFAIQGRWISTHAPAGGATGAAAGRLCQRQNFYSRPCGRGDLSGFVDALAGLYFYSRPCGRGDAYRHARKRCVRISTHAPAGGATSPIHPATASTQQFLLTPLREGRHSWMRKKYGVLSISTHAPAGGATEIRLAGRAGGRNFYSRPCGRGDGLTARRRRGGMTNFYSRPCGRGDIYHLHRRHHSRNFYSRPCGRGDTPPLYRVEDDGTKFLLTPLREGRQRRCWRQSLALSFLLTPLREGRLSRSQPCRQTLSIFLLTPLREGRPRRKPTIWAMC